MVTKLPKNELPSLDSDDVHGPGLCSFPQVTGELPIDFARFTLSKYAQTLTIPEKLQLVKATPNLAALLGPHHLDHLDQVLREQVSSSAGCRPG